MLSVIIAPVLDLNMECLFCRWQVTVGIRSRIGGLVFCSIVHQPQTRRSELVIVAQVNRWEATCIAVQLSSITNEVLQ